jgi:hypothetical protein
VARTQVDHALAHGEVVKGHREGGHGHVARRSLEAEKVTGGAPAFDSKAPPVVLEDT